MCDQFLIAHASIINVLKKWLRYHDYDFQAPEAKEAMEAFLQKLSHESSPPEYKEFATFLRQAWRRTTTTELEEDAAAGQPPKSIPPAKRKAEELTVLDIAPEELARQLTLIQYRMFSKIQNPHLIAALKNVKDPANPVTQISALSDKVRSNSNSCVL